MDRDELLALAREILPRIERFAVCEPDGIQRPITNVEMLAVCQWHEHELMQRKEREGCCCEEGPYSTGKCRHLGGKCGLIVEAERLLWRADNVE